MATKNSHVGDNGPSRLNHIFIGEVVGLLESRLDVSTQSLDVRLENGDICDAAVMLLFIVKIHLDGRSACFLVDNGSHGVGR